MGEGTKARIVVCGALLLALGIVYGKMVRDARVYAENPEFQYADSARPMLSNFDGYFFLRLSGDVAAGAYGAEDPLRAYPRPVPAPLLCRLAAWLHACTGLPMQELGFFLPPLLSCALLAAVLLWARLLGGPWTAAAALLAAALSPYWLEVTAVGRFDKDCLNPVFLLLLAWCFAKNDQARGRARWGYLLAALAVLVPFNWWWQKAAAPISLGFVLLYAVFGYRRASVGERILKILLLSVALIQLLFFLFPQTPGGPLLWERISQAPGLLPLIFKSGSMATVSEAIDELTGLSPLALARANSGSWWGFLGGLAGLAWGALVVREKRRVLVFLAPLLVFGLLSLHVRRFTLLFFPLVALGTGCFVEHGAALLARRVPWLPRQAACAVLAAVLLAPALANAWRHTPAPFLRQGDDQLALALRTASSERAAVWTWWDYGYFLQYRAQRFTLLDGGMQTLRNCMLAASPLACDDPVLAANWIRFFAARGLESFAEISDAKGGDQAAVDWLKEVFSGRRSAPAYFFPEVEAYVFLPVDFLRLSEYWLDFGTLYARRRPEKRNHLELFRAEGFRFEESGVRLSRSCRARGYREFPTVLQAGKDRLDGLALHTRQDPYLIHTPDSPWVYAADFPVSQTLAFQLAVPTGFRHPCFEPVRYDPALGGVWRVRACRPE